jgi:NAD(P) transhydrogenase subunit alpha
MVERMKPGSVIVDVAASSGGNCELTRPGETVEHVGVRIFGPVDLPSRVAHDASQMYARNVASFLSQLTGPDAELIIDLENNIVGGACITHQGQVVHPVVRRTMGLEVRS